MSDAIEVRSGAGVQTWSMGLAPVNAIGPELLGALDARLREAVADESVSVVVLTSGLKVFSAGADASWMAGVVAEHGADGLLEQFNRTMDTFRELCTAMRRSPLLFVAAINGHALAGGLELAAACDLRFAADRERLQIGAPEMDLFGAMPTGGGGAQFLARLMGPSQALRFILDAKPVHPPEALALLGEVDRWAEDVARKAGRIGVAAAKRAILGGAELPLYEALELDRSLHWDSMRRGNFKAGVNAFVEKFG
jgi:enoyl-CoA hydratase/carnithine racemase